MFKFNKDLISKIISRIFLIIFIAFFPTLWVIQNDSRTQNFIQKKVIEILEKEWNAKICVKYSHINIFTGKIVIEDGSIQSGLNLSGLNQSGLDQSGLDQSRNRQDFFWKFKTSHSRFSRLKCIFSQKMSLKVELNDVESETSVENGKPLIVGHLENIFKTNPDLPAELCAVKIRNLKIKSFLTKDSDDNKKVDEIEADFLGELFFKKNKQNCSVGGILLKDGSLFFNEKKVLSSIKCDLDFKASGSDELGSDQSGLDSFIINSNKSFKFLDKYYFVDLEFNGDKKNIFLKNADNSLDLKIENPGIVDSGVENIISATDYKITGTLPVKCLQDIYSFYSDQKSYDQLDEFNELIKLDLNFSTSSNLRLNNFKLNGNFEVANIALNLKALWNLNKKNGRIFVSNAQKISSKDSDFFINSNGFKTSFLFNDQFDVKGKYKIDFLKRETKRKYPFVGDCFYKNKNIKISGKHLGGSYFAKANLADQFYISKLLYLNRDGQKLLEMVVPKNEKESKILKGNIKYALIRDFLPYQLQKNIVGRQAYFEIICDQKKLNNLKGSFRLVNGKLSLLGVYNPIQSIKSDFVIDAFSKKIDLDGFEIGFFKGSINTPSANINFDKSYQLSSIEFPVQIKNLLVNWNRDFYGIVQGDLFLNKNNIARKSGESLYKLLGTVYLKKSLIKSDVFSSDSKADFDSTMFFTDSFFIDDRILEIDVNFLCDRPLRLKTKFLTTDAFLDLNIKTMFTDSGFLLPKITGDINLEKGYLSFFKNKLYLDYATIQFLPTQPNEPIIDLLAKNKIKKYLVTLQVTGALSKPQILLDSSPDLREEEILSLLFAGSETASLQYDFPAMIMQNLEDLINSEQIFSKTTSVLKKIILPFKYIQITPDFSNQVGRGGVKGTVSIDLNKQMHAQIQKNFNLQDDLAFQVEYFLTDDINLKMVKDQRGDIGAEVEVRLRL